MWAEAGEPIPLRHDAGNGLQKKREILKPMAAGAALTADGQRLGRFAATLAPDFEISDLRQAKMGDGFSWGRYGPTTKIERHGTAPMWAIARPPILSRIRHFLFGRARQ